MSAIPNVDNDPLRVSNYFSDDYLATNVRTGVTRNRAGTRLLALSDDFLLGLRAALDQECGPAAATVLKTCGRTWGVQFAKKFEKELSEFYGKPLREFPLMMFEACLIEAFSRHGWGQVKLDYTRQDRGLIIVTLQQSVFAELVGKSEQPVDTLMTGILAGLFSHLSGENLDAAQTECPTCGGQASRFILSLPERLQPVEDWVKEGKTHEEIVTELEQTRA